VSTLENWVSCNGVRIFTRELDPGAEPEKALVVLVHGLGEHSGSHQSLADYLAARGYRVLLSDLRGTGRSDGQRGHVDRFEDFARDIKTLIAERGYDGPLFVLGHSLGGLIALDFTLSYPGSLTGLVLSSPGLGIAMKLPAWKTLLAATLSGVCPRLSQPHGISPAQLTHDTDVLSSYRADPLRCSQTSLRLYTEMVRKMREVSERARELSTPVLLIQGGSDQVVDPGVAKRFFDQINSRDKELAWYDRSLHEVFKDLDGPEASCKLVEWLDRQIARK
jgi:alpha-beta hydrolase superfamily lysophospholipase